MTTATCQFWPVQRSSQNRSEPPGQSLNVEAHCNHSSGIGPLETEWISEELIVRTQEVWGNYLDREIDHEEAIEMLLNVQRIALAFHQTSMEGDMCE